MTDSPNASLYAVDRGTGALTALPHFTRLAVSEIRNGIGKVEVDYPVYGRNFDLLAGNTAEDRDLEVEVWLVGRQEHAVRGVLTDTAGDDLAEDAVWRFEGWTLDVLLDEVLVWPQVGTEKQELVLSGNNAGTIVDYLIDQAQTRGALVGVTTGFTGSLDSNGDAWDNVVTATFSPSATLLDVMQELIEIGMIDAFRLGADRVLHMWNPDGQGVDRTVTTPPVIFRRGRDLMESPRRHTVRNSATTALAVGSENLYVPANDASALARRGRRIEVAASANSLTDAGSVTAYAQAMLTTVTPGTHEVTHGLRIGPGLPIPWVDYAAGDWVWSDTRNTLDRLRIQQLELEYGPAGYAGSVVLNTAVVDRVSAIARKLKRISSGTAVVGTSTSGPEVDDGLAPAQVTGVTATSSAYVGNTGVTWAAVQAGWTAVTTNEDTSLAGDIVGYFPAYRYAAGHSMPTNWQVLPQVSDTSADWSGVVPGKPIDLTVAAIDKWGHLGAWSTNYTFTAASDAAPPPVPSTPVVDSYLGLLTVTWDGLGSVGEAQPADFDRVEIHVSTSSGFTPSSSTRVDSLRGKGTIPWDGGTYGVTYYGKLVAYDRTGNASAGSAQDSATLAQAADGDIGAVSIGKLTAGIMSAIMTISGIIRTSSSGPRVELDADGIHCYDSSGVVFDFDTGTGAAYVKGTIESGVGNDKIVIQPTGSGASGTSVAEISLYGDNPFTRPAYINAIPATDGTLLGFNSGRDADFTGAIQSTIKLAPYSFDMYVNTAPYPTAASSGSPRGAWIRGDRDDLSLRVTNSSGVTWSRYEQSAAAINLEVRSTAGTAIDGGYLWLERGTGGEVVLGKSAGSQDMYLSFDNNTVDLRGNDGARVSMDSPGTVIVGANNNNFVEVSSFGSKIVSNGVIKSFVIDHPGGREDAVDRYLVHGCTESPLAGVEYWSEEPALIGVDGRVTVELPPYFEPLTLPSSRAVLLTPVAGDAAALVPTVGATAIRAGRFTIVGPPGARVSWLVKAARRAEFPVEPRRGDVTVRGTGPYRYLSP